MSNYIINFTDPLKGSFLVRPYTSNGPKFPTTSVLNDTSIAANSTLLVYGKGHPEYGERLDENFLHLLENFSGASEPAIKVAGMLWHREVLYYRDSVGTAFYIAGAGSPLWNTLTLFGTGSLPAIPPAGLQDGDYWYDTTGSPTVLYQYSADERNINGWIAREFDEAAGIPTAAPTKEVQVYDGGSWDVLPDLTQVNGLITGLGTAYLKLDTSNGPLIGDLSITKTFPIVGLTGNDPSIILDGLDGSVAFGPLLTWELLSDDSGTGAFVISSFGVPFVEVSAGGILQVDSPNYETLISANNDIPNKKYVDDAITGVGGSDTFIVSGTFGITGSPVTTGTLTLVYNAGSPSSFDVNGFDSTNIPFVGGLVGNTEPAVTVDEGLLKAAPTNNPFFFGTVTVPGLVGTEGNDAAANKGYVDAQIASVASSGANDVRRSVQSGVTTSFSLPFTFTAGNNRLTVFKNGIKQYKDIPIASILAFSPEIISGATGLTGFGPPGGYVINNVTPALDIWVIGGNYASDFTAGDTFDVVGNSDPASNLTYTIVSAVDVGPDTDLTVSAATIPGTAVADGVIGINYNFQMTLDGVGPSNVGPLNGLNLTTFDNLVTNMQTAIDAAFGAGITGVFLHAGNIRIDNLGAIGGSPPPSISIVNGLVPTTDLFGVTNLAVDGFSFFGGAGPDQYAYFESDGGSPVGIAPGGTTSSTIEFNVATLGTDVIEFLLI